MDFFFDIMIMVNVCYNVGLNVFFFWGSGYVYVGGWVLLVSVSVVGVKVYIVFE